MSNKNRKAQRPEEPLPRPADVGRSEMSAGAPTIYFDGAPTYGLAGSVAAISLDMIRFKPSPDGTGVATDRVTVAHLRMSREALQSLKMAIVGIEAIASGQLVSAGEKISH